MSGGEKGGVATGSAKNSPGTEAAFFEAAYGTAKPQLDIEQKLQVPRLVRRGGLARDDNRVGEALPFTQSLGMGFSSHDGEEVREPELIA